MVDLRCLGLDLAHEDILRVCQLVLVESMMLHRRAHTRDHASQSRD